MNNLNNLHPENMPPSHTDYVRSRSEALLETLVEAGVSAGRITATFRKGHESLHTAISISGVDEEVLHAMEHAAKEYADNSGEEPAVLSAIIFDTATLGWDKSRESENKLYEETEKLQNSTKAKLFMVAGQSPALKPVANDLKQKIAGEYYALAARSLGSVLGWNTNERIIDPSFVPAESPQSDRDIDFVPYWTNALYRSLLYMEFATDEKGNNLTDDGIRAGCRNILAQCMQQFSSKLPVRGAILAATRRNTQDRIEKLEARLEPRFGDGVLRVLASVARKIHLLSDELGGDKKQLSVCSIMLREIDTCIRKQNAGR